MISQPRAAPLLTRATPPLSAIDGPLVMTIAVDFTLGFRA
jgi:hypothetical protein